MIFAAWYDGAQLTIGIPPEKWAELLAKKSGLLWVDIEAPLEDEIDYLTDIFKFHPLAVEDCVIPFHRPKIDEYDDHLYIIFHAIGMRTEMEVPKSVEILELNIFIGQNYVVTFHEDPIPQVAQIRSRCNIKTNLMNRGPGFLIHGIMDQIVDDMTRQLAYLEDYLDSIEDMVISGSEKSMTELDKFKSLVTEFRKIAGPQRDVVRMLSSNTFAIIEPTQALYFRDILDHLLIVTETVTHIRDGISATVDTYISVVNRQMNNVMKALTVVIAIFLPLQFITGIYGMNFRYMPELNWESGYYLVLALMGLVGIFMALLFRKLRWF